MEPRHVLCLAPAAAVEPLGPDLVQAGWALHVVPDVTVARRVLGESPCHVGLLMSSCAGEADSLVLSDFLGTTLTGMEWVGVFAPDALQHPACRDLVASHLFDHHTLPVTAERLAYTLGHAWGHAMLRQHDPVRPTPDRGETLVGCSPAIAALRVRIQRVARVDAPVLITGESGAGKELTALAIHKQSERADQPFVAVNCGAIQPSLIQSELFGHVKGAFTGADRDKRGFIEAARGGTIFLDEIGDMSLELQIILLRFLQEKTVTRVGSTQTVPVDVRVIAATNVDLEAAVRARGFREDLYYRLNVLPLQVPPLRERLQDVPLLAYHFFDQFASEKPSRLRGFSRRALTVLQAHTWPGNVRELMNRVRRATVLAEGRLIQPVDLGLQDPRAAVPSPAEALDEARVEAERSAIRISLQHTGRNITEAARQLGVSRMTLYRLMAKHGISH